MGSVSVAAKVSEELSAWVDAYAGARNLSRSQVVVLGLEELRRASVVASERAAGIPAGLQGNRLDPYPSLPTDPAERLEAVNRRNAAISRLGSRSGPPKA